jgi:hypothetical protein
VFREVKTTAMPAVPPLRGGNGFQTGWTTTANRSAPRPWW